VASFVSQGIVKFYTYFVLKELGIEFDRISATGATVIAEPYGMGGGMVATFADPDGN